MVTRERLEQALANAKSGKDCLAWPELVEAFQHALAWLDVQPRALKDIKGGHALYFELANEDQSTWSQHLWKNRKGEWVAHSLGEPWDLETLAIPFSALPCATPDKVT